MVQPKVRGLEIEAARQANERDRLQPIKSIPESQELRRLTATPNVKQFRPILRAVAIIPDRLQKRSALQIAISLTAFGETSWLRVRVGLINSTSGSCSSRWLSSRGRNPKTNSTSCCWRR